ncbi:amino acid adenylation domain-containing protein [Thiorhodococcus fuscus]|uniref:Amino acid adenylation domain-containing protein n=1 Tax=Thiorhodococcus fuscus TaxID=527200 RepID=A0ABW4YCZ2_9GAMM
MLEPISFPDLRAAFLVADSRSGTLTRIAGDDGETVLSPADLREAATRIARQLDSEGIGRGACVMLVMRDPLAYVTGLWGCIAAGCTAVPMPPLDNPTQQQRTLAAAGVIGRCIVLADEEDARASFEGNEAIDRAYRLIGERFDRIAGLDEPPSSTSPLASAIHPDDIAIIQFSSGSTAAPKGVELTHRAVLAQIDLLKRHLGLTADDRFLSWMPLSHDFGLFHFHILPLLVDLPQVLMAPDDFARRPISWLRAMDRHRTSLTGAPNFALQMVASLLKPRSAAQLDLSALRSISNGAEPLNPGTIAAFLDALAPSGLSRTAITPAYGLAEATLVTAIREPGEPLAVLAVDRDRLAIGAEIVEREPDAPNAAHLCLLGRAAYGFAMRIVDDAGTPLPSGTIGRLEVRGPSLMRGYINDPEQSRAALHEDGWLDTGDIGFLWQEELVLVGRHKDVIIVAGLNYHPADLERVAQEAPGLSGANPVAIVQARCPHSDEIQTLCFVRFRGTPEKAKKLQASITDHVLAKSGLALDQVIPVHQLPRTTSGKLKRYELGQQFEASALSAETGDTEREGQTEAAALRQAVASGHVSEVTRLLCRLASHLSGTSIEPDSGLMDQGVSSQQALALTARIGTWLNRRLDIAVLFDHPTPRGLARALIAQQADASPAPTCSAQSATAGGIAVIGLGCRFPGAENPDAFWDLLAGDHDPIRPIPEDRWPASAWPEETPCPPAALLDDIDRFDGGLFGITRGEAEGMQPLQRLLLQVLWQALEHSGLDPAALRGQRVGLFIGLSESGLGAGDRRLMEDAERLGAYSVTGHASSVAVGRIAHLFDFRGPAIALDTACSSSLVALDMAAHSLRQGTCDLAIAGGANLIISPELHAGLARMGVLSPDGRCKTFAEEADGYGRGEGAGLLVLKRLAEARRSQDHIWAEILGSAVNHDGQSQSVTAPNGTAQRDLLLRALREAGLAGQDVDWVETHGTGTPLGDPIELAALREVLRPEPHAPLPLGAVKSRIGHLEAAAGIAGVIKAILAMVHGRLPRNAPRKAPNSRYDWSSSPLTPLDQALDWDDAKRRVAGISSFGMSGTNVHVLIGQEQVSEAVAPMPNRILVLALSAHTPEALQQLHDRWVALLSERPAEHWPSLCAGQATRRWSGPYRMAVTLMETGLGSAHPPAFKAKTMPRLLFCFTGQGAQFPSMGAELFAQEPLFRDALIEASEAAGPIDGKDLLAWLYGPDAADATRMNRTDLAQPALVAVAHGLMRLWADWGIQPDAVIGHSIGEIPAALAAGQLDLQAAMRLAVRRGQVMEHAAPEGAMLALRADEERAQELLRGLDEVVISGYNAPGSLTLAGSVAQIETLLARADEAGLAAQRLHVTRAFHSPQMRRASAELADGLRLPERRGVIPVYSTATGAVLGDNEMAQPGYWSSQMLSPVRFRQAMAAAAESGDLICIEIGPRNVLAKLGPACAPDAAWIGGGDRIEDLAHAVGQAWSHGAPLDWLRYFGSRGAPGQDLPRLPLNETPIPRRAWSGAAVAPNAPSVPRPTTAASNAQPALGHALDAIVLPLTSRISGIDPDRIDPDRPMVALGLDSLGMVQIQRSLAKSCDLQIDLTALFQTLDTPRKLADHIDAQRPQPAPEPPPPPEAATPASAHPSPDVVALMQEQLRTLQQVMERQLTALGAPAGTAQMPPVQTLAQTPAQTHARKPDRGEIKGLFRQPGSSGVELDPRRRSHVARLARSWNAKSAGSKAGAERARKRVANSRAVFGFAPDYKELTYPLMASRAQGSQVWDLDGNAYVDVTMGFGVYLFGHNPDFVASALREELDRGAPLGPTSPLAAEVAERIHQLTGVDRCAFFATGTEAIMCAVRIARAVTGRDRIVLFKGAYHGSFDGVLATGWIDEDGSPQSAPLTDGTPQGMVDPVIVLDYGDMAGLDLIARHASEIALVLVEPVQSRNPENRPIEFLHALRALTRERDIPLLFDEIISGFRFAPGGMQSMLGIKADLVTYGKVLGCGQPIGVLAGDARLMDVIDGGDWAYGDDSGPGTRTAFVAGTFNAHPLGLAAARAVLDRLIEDAGALQQTLARRTEAMCVQLDRIFEEAGVPVRMERFGSLFRFAFGPGMEILNSHLLNGGIFVWEQRNCFLSTAHSDEDIAKIVEAARRGIAALQTAGWLGQSPRQSESGEPSRLQPAISETAMRRHAGTVHPGTWTDLVILRLSGDRLDPDHLTTAWSALCRRHVALRACLAADGTRCVAAVMAPALERVQLPEEPEFRLLLDRWAQSALAKPFRLDRAPIEPVLLETATGEQALAVRSSHLGFDGWSVALLLRELFQLIEDAPLPEADRWNAYLDWEAQAEFTRASMPARPMHLPCDAEPGSMTAAGGRITRTDIGTLFARVSETARSGGQTPLVGMLAAFALLVRGLTGEERVTIGLPIAGQALSGLTGLVGNVSFIRPVTLDIADAMTLAELRRTLHQRLLEPGAHPPADAMPERHVLFNIDGPIRFGSASRPVALHSVPIVGARADLFANILLLDDQVILDFDWNSDRFSEDSARSWLAAFLEIAERSCAGHATVAQILGDLAWPAPPTAPAQGEAPRPQEPARPSTATEQTLADLWREILDAGTDLVSRDFFDLSGSSLHAVRLLARIRETFGVELSLAQIFGAPLLEDMARQIETASAADGGIYPVRPIPARIPATRQQQQLWLLEQMSEAGPAYNLCLRLDFAYPLDAQALNGALRRVGARHTSLRTRLHMDGESIVQSIASEPDIALRTLDASAPEWLATFVQEPFDLAEGPLWRAGLALPDDGCTLVLVVHHAIADAWSMEILVRDLLGAYQQILAGQDPGLMPLAIDYSDYALARALGTERRDRDLEYWRTALRHAPRLTALAGDAPRPPIKSFAGEQVRLTLAPALQQRMRGLAKRLRTSVYQLVVAAIAQLVARRNDSGDLVLGCVVAGRDLPGLDRPIGFFANTLPLHLVLHEDWRALDLIAAVRSALMAATEHSGCSLQDICTALELTPDPAANPLFEICVTHDDRSGLSQLGAELGFAFAEPALPTSQFDLSFYVVETGDGVSLDLTYATAIFQPQTIAGILDEIERMLQALCHDPEAPIAHGSRTDQLREPSALQKRLWFVDQFENGQLYATAPTYYNMAATFELDASADPALLQQRFAQLLADTPDFRAAFQTVDGNPRISAARIQAPPCASIGGDEVDAQVRRFILAPFDVQTGPLLRMAVVERPHAQRALLLVGHHIIVDEASLAGIADWLRVGTEIPRRPAPDQTSLPDAAVLLHERDFWQRYLGPHPPRLLLPVDRPRAAVHVFGSGFSQVSLNAAEFAAIERLAAESHVALDDLILAGFVSLLSRLSGQEEIVLGQTVPRRSGYPGGQANLVALRIDLSVIAGTAEAIAEIARHSTEVLAHARTDFDQVVLDLKPDNDMSRTALFDVLYVRSAEPVPGREMPPAIGWGKYDLTLAANRASDGGLDLMLVFNTEMFDAETVDHWGRLLCRLLAALCAHGDRPFLSLPLATETEIEQLIAAGGPRQTRATWPYASLPDAVSDRARRMPDMIAVSDAKGTLTYADLELQARALARALIARGVLRGDRVALMLPRDRDTVVAMLAVLCAGAAFVPMDLSAAPERTARILADAQAVSVIVKGAMGRDLLPLDLPRVDMTRLAEDRSEVEPEWPAVRATDGAYVIFTSGSSGRPKGVMVEHRNVLALMLGQEDLFPVAAGDRWSWFHSPAFDFSIWEIWGALLTGGRIVVIPEAARDDFALLRAQLKQQEVTVLSLTPSAFKVLSDQEMNEAQADLAVRSIWLGGEALTPTQLRAWSERYPECRLINLFGITETTVHTTFRHLTKEDLDRTDSLIGRPLPSYGVTIRDAELRPVPATVQGEILVSGSGVARGYLGQPDLTAARFVEDPYRPESRLYRSGDLGRYDLAGELTYLGRADSQVKVRGFRIELGEIETALSGFPSIRKAVVGTRGIAGEETALAAWMIADAEPDADRLSAYLAKVLPAYMIPKHLYRVDRIPLTLNGKADLRALAGMCDRQIGAATEGDAPRPGLETEIAAILCELLGRTEMSRSASFFALGGHSLMANQAVLRLRKRLGLQLTLRDFFTAQTIAALAVLKQDSQHTETTGIVRTSDADSYPLSSAQRRLFAIQTAHPNSASYNMVGGFIVSGDLDPEALATAFADLVDRHEILRTRFLILDGEARQLIDPPGRAVALDPIRNTDAADEQAIIDRALDAEFGHVFVLSQGPLFRVRLTALGPERWLMVLNLHHIISDGWSVPVMIADLSRCYAARAAGSGPPRLRPLAIQYRDFASWQQTACANPEAEAALAHWRARLASDAPLQTALPTDSARTKTRAGRGAMALRRLDEERSRALRSAAARSGLTLFSVFAATLHILLELRGESGGATVIGTADAGRDALETEDQLGFYLNLLPHVLSGSADLSIERWIELSRAETVAMLAHKAYPFDRMLEELAIDTLPGHSPIFDILLLVQTNADPQTRLGDLELRMLPDQTRTARYDLSLMVEDRPAIELLIEYDTDLFRAQTIDWLFADLLSLLDAFVDSPSLSPLAILARAEPALDPNLGLLDLADPLLEV